MKKSLAVVVCLLAGAVVIATAPTWALMAEQEAKLLPADGESDDYFGRGVALDGDTAIVGAPENINAPGSAYVFTRVGSSWTEQTKILASDGYVGDGFGWDVALEGDTMVIGAPYDYDNGGLSGSAYVFTRVGTVWTEQAKLLASDGVTFAKFGRSVALDGDTLVIGAPGDDDNGEGSGSAYVFTRSGGVWTEQAKLSISDGGQFDYFGWDVALDGDMAIIGRFQDMNGPGLGSAYVFTRTGGAWTEETRLLASDGQPVNQFGKGVALDGDTAIVGAPRHDDNGEQSGSAYVFIRTGVLWTEEAKLLASDGAAWDYFGVSVALDGDTALVGANRDGGYPYYSGSAYVFTRSGGVWTEEAKLLPTDGADGDEFGQKVALNGSTALIGAARDDDNGDLSGSAFVFRMGVDVPAADVVGLLLLLIAVLGTGVYFMRRRETN
jgi:hypothetical protein